MILQALVLHIPFEGIAPWYFKVMLYKIELALGVLTASTVNWEFLNLLNVNFITYSMIRDLIEVLRLFHLISSQFPFYKFTGPQGELSRKIQD